MPACGQPKHHGAFVPIDDVVQEAILGDDSVYCGEADCARCSKKRLALARTFRTKAVPHDVSDEELGGWYLIPYRPTPIGTPWPDSYHHQVNGSSSWPTWCVHKAPRDVAAPYVARLHAGTGRPTDRVIVGETLEEVRCQLPEGLRRYDGRSSFTDSTNVEAWL